MLFVIAIWVRIVGVQKMSNIFGYRNLQNILCSYMTIIVLKFKILEKSCLYISLCKLFFFYKILMYNTINKYFYCSDYFDIVKRT
jgi:hypothetical protein